MDDNASRLKVRWTKEQDATILSMRAKLLPWKAIAERAVRTVESCTARYRALLPSQARVRGRGSKRWSEEELGTLDQLIAQHKTVSEIAAQMNKTKKVVHAKIEYINRPVRKRADARLFIPPSRLEDRDRRMAFERNITAEFFGDPRPGQSALDQREARL